jgi:hypothetical protein
MKYLIPLLLLLTACTTQVTNFEECIKAGNPVMESYPRQCSANGKTFTEEIKLPVAESLVLSTDKDLYHSGEPIKLSLEVFSSAEIPNAKVKFYGVNAKSRLRLSYETIKNIARGDNLITYDFIAPSCYGCAGVSPGTYQVTAEILQNNSSLANTTINIELRQ